MVTGRTGIGHRAPGVGGGGFPVRRMPGAGSLRRGFLLVDVLVATILLGVSLTVLLTLTGRATGSQRVGDELATAAALADEQLQMVLARGPDDYAKRFGVEGACDAPFENYRYTLKFTGGGSVGEAYAVSATITWISGAAAKSITIDTLIASRNAGEDGEPDPVRTPASAVVRTP